MPAISPTRFPPFALALLLLGCCGIAAAWVVLAVASDRQASWMAVVAAVDAVLMLRLGRMPAGWHRSLCAVLGTGLVVVLANWGIAATHVGHMVGLLPWDALLRMGPHFTWTLTTLANGPGDLAWWGAALVLAAIASR